MSAMAKRSVPRGLVLSIAFFGVFVGHAITYVLLAGNPVVRSTMLRATGHGYLPATVHAALALAVIGLAGVFLAGLGSPRSTGSGLVRNVATFQVLCFAAIEVAERLAARAPLHDLIHVLPVGTVVQIGVAIVVALVIRCLLRAADVAAETATGLASPPHPALVPLIGAPSTAIPPHDRSVPRGRAPPR
jgi:hypothetical protein